MGMDTSRVAVKPSRWYMESRHTHGARVAHAGALLFLVPLLCLSPGAFLAPAFAIPTIPLTGGGKKGEQHRQVEKLEKQWRVASLAGDTATMASLMSDTYIGIGPDGTLANKTEELQARGSGQQKFAKLDIEDRKIRIYGTTAVVTSKALVEGVYDGRPISGDYRYTRVWSFSHAQWKIVSFEANRVHDESERKR